MTACPREKEIAALVRSGYWPQASDPALLAHADSCARCTDFLLVSEAFQAARVSSIQNAPLAAPGLIWWRAQIRRRNEAVERISKPVTRAQIFALGINLAVGLALVVSQARNGANWLGWLAGFNANDLKQSISARTSEFWASMVMNQGWNLTLLVTTVGAVALLTGVAIFLAVDSRFEKP